MGDIIIPKRTFGSFMLGLTAAFVVLFIIGGVFAATVYEAGGGQLSGLGEPSADDDAATKSYVDTATGATWVTVSTSNCNGARCYYDRSITSLILDYQSGDPSYPSGGMYAIDATVTTANWVCTNAGHQYAVAYKASYWYSAVPPNCNYRTQSDTWIATTCLVSTGTRYRSMGKVLCVG